MKFKFVKALSLVLIAASILSVTGCSNGYKNSILSSVALYVDEDCTLVDKTRGRESLTYFYKLDNRDNLYFSVSCSEKKSNSFGGSYDTRNSYEDTIRSLYTEDINNCIESFDLNITDVQSYYSLPGYYVDCYDDEDLNQVLDAIDAASEIFSVEQEYHEKECTIIAARFQINYYVNDEHMLKFNIRIYCEIDREQILADIHEIIDYCVTEDYWDSMKLYIIN
ncbi:MAG: hypothetical protein MJ172_06265 [Clostridia bacterium]|nr:hypothetical protein [Clostridia bacterium]